MKNFTSIVLLLTAFFSGKSFAQFNTVWTANYQHTTASGYSNESRKVVTDPSGNAYVLADVTSNIDPAGVVSASTWHYTVLSKYSPTGALITSKSINVVSHMIANFNNNGSFGLERDPGGNLYIGYIMYDATTNFDVLITKYNSNLVRLWSRKFNSSGLDVGIDLAIAGGGDAYAIVKSTSGANVTYHLIKANSQVTNDTALISFAQNTEVLNALTFRSGAIFATGYRIISGVKSIMTVKVNTSGSLKWTNINNGGLVAGDDFGKAITAAPDGNIYVTGTSARGTTAGNDVFILKILSGGATSWISYRNFSIYDAGLFIEAIDVDNVYIGSSSGFDVMLDQVDTHLGIAGGRYIYHPVPASPYQSLNGVILSDFKVSPNYAFYLTGSTLATDASNRLFSASYLIKLVFADHFNREAFNRDSEMPINGDFNSSRSATGLAFNNFNDDISWLEDNVATYANHSIEKVVLSDIDMVSPIRSGNPANTLVNVDDVSVTPNPSNSIITVIANEKITHVELFDMKGKSVKVITPFSDLVKMDMSDLMKGIYIGRIYLESGNVSTRKVVRN